MQEGRDRAAYWQVLFICVVGAFLRAYNISGLPLWLDEGLTYFFSSRSFVEIWASISRFELSPPLFYSLQKVWRVFGTDEAALRSLSAAFGVAAVVPIFATGRLLSSPGYGNWLGATAGLLQATSALHVRYSQEMRPYEALTFAVALAFYGLVWLIRNPREAQRPWLGLSAVVRMAREQVPCECAASLRWGALIAGSALALWFHNIAIIYVASLALGASLSLRAGVGANRAVWSNLLVAGVAVLVLWLPNLYLLTRQVDHLSALNYIAYPNVPIVLRALRFAFTLNYPGHAPLHQLPASSAVVIDVLVGLLALLGLRQLYRRFGGGMPLAFSCLALLPIALSLVISLTFRPVLLNRTLIAMSVPLPLLLATAALSFRHAGARIALIALLVSVSGAGTWNYYRLHSKTPWDVAAEYVLSESGPGDRLLFANVSAQTVFDYYLGTSNLPRTVYPRSLAEIVERDAARDSEWLDQFVATEGRIWVVTRYRPRGAPVLEYMASHRALKRERRFGRVGVLLYE